MKKNKKNSDINGDAVKKLLHTAKEEKKQDNGRIISASEDKLEGFSIKRLLKSSATLRFKLIASFMVPIAFIVILGLYLFVWHPMRLLKIMKNHPCRPLI